MTLTAGTSRALWFVVCSAALALLTLSAALWMTRTPGDAALDDERLTGNTPERAAERFIEAYRSGAFERASHFATQELARTLPTTPAEGSSSAPESFLVQESHRLSKQRLRLSGSLVQEGQAEADGRSVSLTLRKQNGRYLVEEIAW